MLVLCRTLQKARETNDTINKECASVQATCGRLIPIECELSSFASIRAAAATIKETVENIDIIILNAGIMAPPLSFTEDGYEVSTF